MAVLLNLRKKGDPPKKRKMKKIIEKKEDGRGRPKTAPATLAIFRIEKKLDALLKFHNIANPEPCEIVE